MTVISIALCFIPVIGGLIAGLVGGYRIGKMSTALVGGLISAVVAGVLSWLLLSLALPHIISVSAGVGVLAWVLVSEFGLISGAAIGAISHPAETPA
jgi:hypothetical protein